MGPALWLALALAGAADVPAKPVLVAVIDDGFAVQMPEARPFWFDAPWQAGAIRNAGALPGWDLADRDSDVRPPAEKAEEYWHGSAVVSLLALRLREHLGENAARRVKILPIKVLADAAARPNFSQGYDGIRLAAELGAKVILCAWSGGAATPAQRESIRRARSRGALIVASAGNAGSRQPQHPAALPGVLGVGAVDSLGRRLLSSCHGSWVGMAAPGDTLSLSVAPLLPRPVGFARTSRAASEVAALAAAVLATSPGLTPDGVRRILMGSAAPLEVVDPSLVGALGAGRLDAASALRMARQPDRGAEFHDSRHPAGIFLPRGGKAEWRIEPAGDYEELRLVPVGKLPPQGRLEVLDSGRIVWSGSPRTLGSDLRVLCSRPVVRWQGPDRRGWGLEYHLIGVDSTRLYCSGTAVLAADSGILEDGSGPSPYARGSECRWRIRASPGQRLRIDFDAMDTRPNVDVVHLFDGRSTRQDRLLAIFSGTRTPPALVAPSNELLVWFVTGASRGGQGWRMRWKAVPDSTTIGVVDAALRERLERNQAP